MLVSFRRTSMIWNKTMGQKFHSSAVGERGNVLIAISTLAVRRLMFVNCIVVSCRRNAICRHGENWPSLLIGTAFSKVVSGATMITAMLKLGFLPQLAAIGPLLLSSAG